MIRFWSVYVIFSFLMTFGYSQENFSEQEVANKFLQNKDSFYDLQSHTSLQNKKRKKEKQQKTSSVFCCKDNDGFFFHGDFLYWKPRNNVWMISLANISNPQDTVIELKTLRPDFQWESGLRIGVGYNLPMGRWDIALDWTHLTSKAKRNFSSPPEESNVLVFLLGLPVGEASTLEGSWKLNYHTWDLEFGKSFYPGYHFLLRPFFGFRGIYTKQTFVTFVENLENTDFSTLKITSFEKFYGGGIHAGGEGEWYFCKYVGLFSKLSGSLLFGKAKAPSIAKTNLLVPFQTGGETDQIKIINQLYEIRSSFQTIFGICGGSCFHQNSKFFQIKAAFEMNYYLDKETAFNFSFGNTQESSLELMGFTLEARLEF